MDERNDGPQGHGPRDMHGAPIDAPTDAMGRVPPVVSDWGGGQSPISGAPARERPGGLWNPLNLLFRPTRHFRGAGAMLPTGALLLMAMFTSVGFAFDRLELRWMQGRIKLPADNWWVVWAMVIFGGILAGTGRYWILGWWHKVRVGWSGAKDVDGLASRGVFVQAGLIWGFALVAASVIATVQYDTPQAYLLAESSYWYFVLTVFPFWAALVSYKGVRATFDVNPWAARFWFLALPWGFALLGFAVVVTVVLFTNYIKGPEADTDRTQRHESSFFTLTYPGNWALEAEPEDSESIAVYLTMQQDASISLELYLDDGMTPDERVAQIIEAYGENGLTRDAQRAQDLNAIGGFTGEGRQVTLKGAFNSDYRARLLLHPLPDGWVLEIREVLPAGAVEQIQPGLDLVYGSLRPRTLADVPADVGNAWTVRTPDFEYDVPGNWDVYDEEGGDEFVVGTAVYPPQDVYTRVFSYNSDRTSEAEAQATIEWAADEREYTILEPITGGDSVAGAWFEVDTENGTRWWMVRTQRFEDGRVLEMSASWAPERDSLVRPGLELMIRTLKRAATERDDGAGEVIPGEEAFDEAGGDAP